MRCAQTRYGGVVAACGLAQGMDLPSSVAPFILRGVTLAGIDSVMAPLARRESAWQRLARDLDAQRLEAMTEEIALVQAIARAARSDERQGARAHRRSHRNTEESPMNYQDFYRASIEQPDAFWAEQVETHRLAAPVRHGLRLQQPAVLALVRRRARPTCATTRSIAMRRRIRTATR